VHGICAADRDDMFVDMIPVHVVEMAVVKIVNMGVMANSRVPTGRAMLVGMVGMVRLGAGDHEIPLPLVCNPVHCFSGYILSRIAPFGLLGCSKWHRNRICTCLWCEKRKRGVLPGERTVEEVVSSKRFCCTLMARLAPRGRRRWPAEDGAPEIGPGAQPGG
jgi:hypothetical protein